MQDGNSHHHQQPCETTLLEKASTSGTLLQLLSLGAAAMLGVVGLVGDGSPHGIGNWQV